MNARNDGPLQGAGSTALFWLVLLVSCGLGWILLPFYGSILWGSIIALLFTPLYRRLLLRLNGEGTAAAILTLLTVVVIVIIPLALITATLAQDAAHFYQRMQSGEVDAARYFRGLFEALPTWLTVLLDRFGLVDNLLRPALVGKDTRLPDYMVMITTLGGMAVFGINGFVLGPVIAALFMAVWHIYSETQDDSIPA